MSLQTVLAEICAEREYQDGQWGMDFDNKNTLNDWIVYIMSYAGEAARMDAAPEQQREHILKVATLAVAAVESFDRNRQFAPRHYEDRVPAGTRPGDDKDPVIPNAWVADELAAQKPAEDRGLLTGNVAIDRYFAFLAGGIFGVFVVSAVALVIELFGLSVR